MEIWTGLLRGAGRGGAGLMQACLEVGWWGSDVAESRSSGGQDGGLKAALLLAQLSPGVNFSPSFLLLFAVSVGARTHPRCLSP